jgi:hypothetical protein
MKRPILFLIVLAIFSGSLLAAQEQTANSEKLGIVHFPVSCTPAAQQQFDVAVSMLHSFWYPQDFNAFAEVAKADPTCAMAYWGMAMSRRTNPLVGAPNRVVLQEGLDAIAKAQGVARANFNSSSARRRRALVMTRKLFEDAAAPCKGEPNSRCG